MFKWYITVLPDKSVTYGKLYGMCFLTFHKYIGIRTPDLHEDPLAVALDDIRRMDDNPNIQFHFNQVPADTYYGHY